MKGIVRIITVSLLVVLLSACGVTEQPSRSLVGKAIALQVSETQTLLTQELRLKADQSPRFSIDRVEIVEQTPLEIQDLPAYHLRGTYDLTLKISDRQVTQRQNPFDLYLQRQIEGKTWRLARYQPGDEETEATWLTQLVPPN